mmetsp:Transcript_23438/g.36674  ORF Transcript_23438/g.36674 Transcript_23438/m.36674 type:complete len:86 (+) Transcript_23438:1701-1958(+)
MRHHPGLACTQELSRRLSVPGIAGSSLSNESSVLLSISGIHILNMQVENARSQTSKSSLLQFALPEGLQEGIAVKGPNERNKTGS